MKKVYTAAVGAQVAVDLLKEEKSLAQISAEYAVHANVLREWRTQALKGLATIFERRDMNQRARHFTNSPSSTCVIRKRTHSALMIRSMMVTCRKPAARDGLTHMR
jgi:transposase-like protein